MRVEGGGRSHIIDMRLTGLLQDTVILSADAILDHKAVDAMYVSVRRPVRFFVLSVPCSLLSGYSRFPVHEPGNPLAFVGLLLIKKVRSPVCFLIGRVITH